MGVPQGAGVGEGLVHSNGPYPLRPSILGETTSLHATSMTGIILSAVGEGFMHICRFLLYGLRYALSALL